MNAAELVGLLAEPERLRVVAALAPGARTPDEILDRRARRQLGHLVTGR